MDLSIHLDRRTNTQTSFVPDKEQYNFTRSQLLAQLDVAMGGRVAEEIVYGIDQVTTGECTRTSLLRAFFVFLALRLLVSNPIHFSSTPHPLLIHSSSTSHPLFIHSSSTLHTLLIHSSSTFHPLLIHSSSTLYPLFIHSSGAHSDFSQATAIATAMVKQYGMSEKVCVCDVIIHQSNIKPSHTNQHPIG